MLNEACCRGIPALSTYKPNPTKRVTPNRPLQHHKSELTHWYLISDRWAVSCFNRIWRTSRCESFEMRIATQRTSPPSVLSNSEFAEKLAYRNFCLLLAKLSPEEMLRDAAMAAISVLTELRPQNTRTPYTSTHLVKTSKNDPPP